MTPDPDDPTDATPFAIEKWKDQLELLELNSADQHFSQLLQAQVIEPNLVSIIDNFYHKLGNNASFRQVLENNGTSIEQLSNTHQSYLLSLGVDFDHPHYFASRYQVGLVHAQIGLPLSLYECAFRVLQQELIDQIPRRISVETQDFAGLVAFILKITTLDMALAIEAYHNSTITGLNRSLHSLRRVESGLRRKVETDDLTGAASHAHSFRMLEIRMRQARQNRAPLCISMLDLDYFKNINDRYGHTVGDQVLQDVVARMKRSVRDFDLVGRYGGEEFLIIFYDADMHVATEIAERLRMRIAEAPIHLHDIEVHTSLSQGIAEFRSEEDLHSLVARADKALYEAKRAGRNKVVTAH